MGDVVAVIGEGMLAEFVCGELPGSCKVIRQTDFEAGVPEAAALILVLQDDGNSSVTDMAEEMIRPSGIPWLSGFLVGEEAVVGPLVRKGKPGCSQCADMRRLMATQSNQVSEQQLEQLLQGETPRHAAVSRWGIRQAGSLLAAEVERVLQGRPAHTEGRLYFINLRTLESSLHSFLSDPQCGICGGLPDDSPEAARITLAPSPKISADRYRCRSMDDLKEALEKDYLDGRTGLMNEKMVEFSSPFADVCVNVPLFGGDEVTAGRSLSYADSGLTAIMEGLERYCGIAPRGKRTLIHDSYLNVANQALNPVTVGVHAKEQYAQPDFPFEPFDPNRPIDWVWGYSLLQERPILVPELLAYYSAGFGDGFVYETSNGCALGGSMEEAIFYGMLEVVERDAFLMTWYAQLPVPRLDPYSADDKELRFMIDRLQMVAGYEVYIFDTTMENGIPSVWVLAKNRKTTGVNLICAAGAHLDPIRAVKSAIHELAGMQPMLSGMFEENREEYRQMLDDPFRVERMEHHSMLYGLPQAQERLQFLLDESRPLRTFAEQFKPKALHHDLTDDLKDMLQVFNRLKLDVIVVDQSAPETLRNGLHCVKVLIPGMLPMTFGHHLTRLTGLERVGRVPVQLGYAKEPLSPRQLNPYPHPFP